MIQGINETVINPWLSFQITLVLVIELRAYVFRIEKNALNYLLFTNIQISKRKCILLLLIPELRGVKFYDNDGNS